MLRVYCDTGGYDKRLKALVAEGLIAITTYNYENATPSIKERAVGVMPTWKQAQLRWDDARGSWEQVGRETAIFAAVLDIVGKGNRTDAQHLAAAFNDSCAVFMTSDKDDIWSHRERLEGLLSLQVFHNPSELDDAIAYIRLNSQGGSKHVR